MKKIILVMAILIFFPKITFAQENEPELHNFEVTVYNYTIDTIEVMLHPVSAIFNGDKYYSLVAKTMIVSQSGNSYNYINNEPITYGDGFIYYTDDFGFGKVNRKCTIEKNKFKEILEKEYPLEKKDGEITDPITLYSLPDIKSSVVEKTYINEKVSIIACNQNEYNPSAKDENVHSLIWFKIKTEKGKTGWTNKANGRIKGEGINWAG